MSGGVGVGFVSAVGTGGLEGFRVTGVVGGVSISSTSLWGPASSGNKLVNRYVVIRVLRNVLS